jgi:hypothetical protein
MRMVEMVGVLTQFRWTPLVPKPGDEVTFADDLNNIIKIDFGDGHFWVSTSATDKFPVKHIYMKDGKFKVTAVSKDPVGNTGTDTQEITVAIAAPVVPPVVPPVEPPVEPSIPGYFSNLLAAIIAFLKAIFGIKS